MKPLRNATWFNSSIGMWKPSGQGPSPPTNNQRTEQCGLWQASKDIHSQPPLTEHWHGYPRVCNCWTTSKNSRESDMLTSAPSPVPGGCCPSLLGLSMQTFHLDPIWSSQYTMGNNQDIIKLFPLQQSMTPGAFSAWQACPTHIQVSPSPGISTMPLLSMGPQRLLHFFEYQHNKCHWLFTNLKQLLAMITTKYSLHPAIFTTFWLGLLMIHNDIPFPDVSAKLLTILRSTVTAQTRLG